MIRVLQKQFEDQTVYNVLDDGTATGTYRITSKNPDSYIFALVDGENVTLISGSRFEIMALCEVETFLVIEPADLELCEIL